MDQWKPDEVEAHIGHERLRDSAREHWRVHRRAGAFADGMWVRYDGEGRPPVTDGPFAETKDLSRDG
jgi:hypothetical protein